MAFPSKAVIAGIVGLMAQAGSSGPVRAQLYTPRAQLAVVSGSETPTYKPVVGERAIYDVEVKGHGVGSGSLEILGHELVDGHQTMHAALKINGGILFAKVNDQIESWFDPAKFVSRRFAQNQKELTHTRVKNYLISPEKGTVTETEKGDVEKLSTNEPLDDVSMLLYVRTLPLRVGEVDTIPRYFKPNRDVIIRVLRKETVTVPAGTFQTIVVQPTITNAGGLFGQGGKAEVYLSDDPTRTIVKLTSSMPVLGSVGLTLKELRANN